MDSLSRLISLQQMRSSIDVHCQLQGNWMLPHAAGALNDIRWHAILAGNIQLNLPAQPPQTLPCGTVILLPQSSAHRLLPHYQQHTSDAQLLCGCISIDPAAKHLLAALPALLIYHEAHPWLLTTLQRLQAESQKPRPGHQALCDQLSLTLLTLTLRHWLETQPQHSGLFSLLLHPRLGAVALAMLQSPAESWTVASLAQQAHLSRASFARQFHALTGSTPLLLLTTIRMAHAAALLARQPLPLADIAAQAGYASESAFHKAFVRHHGITPGDYRRRIQRIIAEPPSA